MPRVDKRRRFRQVFDSDTPKAREQLIRAMDGERPDPFVTVRLSSTQTRNLSEYILCLDDEDFRALALFYGFHYSIKRIQRRLRIRRARGTIAYLKDRLTQCMELPRPIAEIYWRKAVNLAIDRWRGAD